MEWLFWHHGTTVDFALDLSVRQFFSILRPDCDFCRFFFWFISLLRSPGSISVSQAAALLAQGISLVPSRCFREKIGSRATKIYFFCPDTCSHAQYLYISPKKL